MILYGSYARGEQTEESDIDVFALVDLSKNELAKYHRIVSEVSSDLDLEYDVLPPIKLQDAEAFQRYTKILPLFRNVVKDGIRITERYF